VLPFDASYNYNDEAHRFRNAERYPLLGDVVAMVVESKKNWMSPIEFLFH
jgi:hypothetical protein